VFDLKADRGLLLASSSLVENGAIVVSLTPVEKLLNAYLTPGIMPDLLIVPWYSTPTKKSHVLDPNFPDCSPLPPYKQQSRLAAAPSSRLITCSFYRSLARLVGRVCRRSENISLIVLFRQFKSNKDIYFKTREASRTGEIALSDLSERDIKKSSPDGVCFADLLPIGCRVLLPTCIDVNNHLICWSISQLSRSLF